MSILRSPKISSQEPLAFLSGMPLLGACIFSELGVQDGTQV